MFVKILDRSATLKNDGISVCKKSVITIQLETNLKKLHITNVLCKLLSENCWKTIRYIYEVIQNTRKWRAVNKTFSYKWMVDSQVSFKNRKGNYLIALFLDYDVC